MREERRGEGRRGRRKIGSGGDERRVRRRRVNGGKEERTGGEEMR